MLFGCTAPEDSASTEQSVVSTDDDRSAQIELLFDKYVLNEWDVMDMYAENVLCKINNVEFSGRDNLMGGFKMHHDALYSEIAIDDASIQNLTVTEALNVSNSGLSTFSGRADFNDSVDIEDNLIVAGIATVTGNLTASSDVSIASNLSVTGLSTFTGISTFSSRVGIISDFVVDGNTTLSGIATITRLEATDVNVSGVVTAASFVGGGQIGVRSEGTFIGTGVTMVDFKSSNTQNTVDFDATAGIATVTVTTGVSLGLAIALGG